MGEQRRTPEAGSGGKICPWCGGRLEFRESYPLMKLVAGDVRARAHEAIPESLITTRAWVCATPHCRYRQAA